MANTNFELSSLQSNYNGSLAGLALTGRWDLNATQTGKLLLNPYTGLAHNTGVQNWLTSIKNYSQTGAGQSGQKVLNTVFVSPVISSGTALSSLFSGQLMAQKSVTNGEFVNYGYVSVMDGAGNLKSVLATFEGNSFYPASTYTNKSIPAKTLSSYIFGSGERLVVEVGVKSSSPNTGNHKFIQKFGHNPNTGDLPIDNSTTIEKNPWFSVASTINFV